MQIFRLSTARMNINQISCLFSSHIIFATLYQVTLSDIKSHYIKKLYLMALSVDAKFKGKLICAF